MKPKVAIVVLNWNGYHLTKACVESLERITWPNYEIIIVDNGSTDGSAPKLRAEFSCHTVIVNEANLGFARGCNVGLRHALAEQADYVLLVNNDSTVERSFLEPAVELMESDPAAGLVTGKIYFQDDPSRIWYAGGKSSLIRGHPLMIGRGQLDRGQFDHRREIEFATGALMLIRSAVIRAVGLLPEEYFFGEEDWDYCTAIRRRGYRLYYVPQFVIHHKPHGSHSCRDAKYVYSFHRGRLMFLSKTLPRPLFALWKLTFRFCGSVVMKRCSSRGDRKTRALFAFAVSCAARDHRQWPRGPITEQDLLRFEAESKAEFALRPEEARVAPCRA
jgi:GT2 family glycosyltransferase